MMIMTIKAAMISKMFIVDQHWICYLVIRFFTQLPVPPTHIHVLAWLLSPKLQFVFGTKIGCCGNAKVPVLPRSIKICCPDQQLQFLWLGRKERVWPVSVQVRKLQTGTIKEKQRGEKREYFQTRSREGPSGGTSWKHCGGRAWFLPQRFLILLLHHWKTVYIYMYKHPTF